MTSPRHLLLLTWLAALVLPHAIAQDWQPGLVAHYKDGRSELHTIVPTIDMRLRAEQSVHPQIAPTFTAEWSGLLRIHRAGRYRLISDASIELNEQAAGDLVQLPTGAHPLRIRFERPPGEAVVTLRWESEFFSEEPVPSEALGHSSSSTDVKRQQQVDRGRLLFAELGCGNCHAAADWQLQDRRGPELTDVAARATSAWTLRWLKEPRDYRRGAVMPVCLNSDEQRADVAAFLATLGKPAASTPEATPQQVAFGETVYRQVGCDKCHDKEHSLARVAEKYTSAQSLADYIYQPHRTDPGGRMPQFFHEDERHLAAAVAEYLFARSAAGTESSVAAVPGDARRGAELFATRGCHRCHAVHSNLLEAHAHKAPAAPSFGRAQGLPLRRLWTFDRGSSRETSTGSTPPISGKAEWPPGRVASASNGPSATAIRLDGQSYIEADHFPRPGTMTITVWVKTEQGGSIITWGRPGGGLRGSREFRMNIGQDGKNSLCYGEYNSDGGWRPVIAKPQVHLTDGQWRHLAVVRQNDQIQLYVEGQPVGEAGRSQRSGGDYTDRLLIGALGLQANPSNRFQGEMDDLAVWETALTAEQIAELASGKSAADLAAPPDSTIEPFRPEGGCLADQPPPTLPNYRLGSEDQEALRSFLKTVQTPHGPAEYHDSPRVQRDLLIQQFRCTACHQLDDQNIQTARRVTDDGEIVAVERPPLLTGVGHKLTLSRLRGVLMEGERNRPWLGLRMPHFGPGVARLPDWFAACAGRATEEPPPPDRDLAEAGLALIGKQRGKAACIACHNYRGINRRRDGVTPAPDLAEAGRTIREDWFLRWMHDPQRLQPGTSMPQFFLDVSEEERELKIAQLWSAIYYQQQLPLPAGVLERKTDGTRIVVNDRPVLFRMATKTPVGQIDRAINVGIPGGLNYTFDPVDCRLKYVWRGEFINAAPAWNGRGGNPVSAGSDAAVAFARGNSLEMGEATPQFMGYRLIAADPPSPASPNASPAANNRLPVFRYRLGKATVEHEIQVAPETLTQRFTVKGAAEDVTYVGGDVEFVVKQNGKRLPRDGMRVRLPTATTLTFEVEVPLR